MINSQIRSQSRFHAHSHMCSNIHVLIMLSCLAFSFSLKATMQTGEMPRLEMNDLHRANSLKAQPTREIPGFANGDVLDEKSHHDLSDLFSEGDHKIVSSPEQPSLEAPLQFKLERMEYFQYPVASHPGSAPDTPGNSGYHALKNAFLTLRLMYQTPKEQKQVEEQLKDAHLAKKLFLKETDPWRSQVIELRKTALTVDYIKDTLLLSIKGAKKISYKEITTYDFYPLYLEQAVVVFDKKESEIKHDELTALTQLFSAAAKNVIAKASTSNNSDAIDYTFDKESLLKALEEEAAKKAKSSSKFAAVQKREVLEKYLGSLQTMSFKITSAKNENALQVAASENFHKRTYGPSEAQESLNGDWLSSIELAELAQKERIDGYFSKDLELNIPVKCLEFTTQESPATELETEIKCRWLLDELEKASSVFSCILLISCENHWISCVVTKIKEAIYLVVTDSKNKDRRLEPGIMKLMNRLDVGLNKKSKESSKGGKKKDDDFLRSLFSDSSGSSDFGSLKSDSKLDSKKETSKEDKQKMDEFLRSLLPEGGSTASKPSSDKSDKKEEKPSYKAPLENVPLEELPALEEFFGPKIPNFIRMILKQMETQITNKRSVATCLNNCFILHGPPGTGKSMVAQIMARKAGRKVIYSGGGDFRDAYQGSGKAKLDALFAEAKKYPNACVIIDEIDAAGSKLEPHASTQEDNRARGSFITTLDEYLYDPSIFVICTTNYPEKIDPAILRRFNCIEIQLPDYEKRKSIFEYYFKKNEIEIKENTANAVSPQFFHSLLEATAGFSGDGIGKIVNFAAYEAEQGLVPEEEIGLGFRFGGFNLIDGTFTSNLKTILAAPLIPFAHLMNAYPCSEFDKHLYCQYKRQQKLKDENAEREAANDPTNRYKDKSRIIRWTKTIGSATASSAWNAAIHAAVTKGYDKYKHNVSWLP